ncbi:hypothetical protein PENSPDRAFT_668316 [Peniophora sp. CONT]|nr:hypothetical protein PENSPDRAFT_668316 [Peniophora sp. CONT]
MVKSNEQGVGSTRATLNPKEYIVADNEQCVSAYLVESTRLRGYGSSLESSSTALTFWWQSSSQASVLRPYAYAPRRHFATLGFAGTNPTVLLDISYKLSNVELRVFERTSATVVYTSSYYQIRWKDVPAFSFPLSRPHDTVKQDVNAFVRSHLCLSEYSSVTLSYDLTPRDLTTRTLVFTLHSLPERTRNGYPPPVRRRRNQGTKQRQLRSAYHAFGSMGEPAYERMYDITVGARTPVSAYNRDDKRWERSEDVPLNTLMGTGEGCLEEQTTKRGRAVSAVRRLARVYRESERGMLRLPETGKVVTEGQEEVWARIKGAEG